MADIIFQRTFGCAECIYIQNSDPYDPIQQSADYFPGVPLGMCPRGFMARVDSPLHHKSIMAIVIGQDLMVQTHIPTQEEIDQKTVLVTNEKTGLSEIVEASTEQKEAIQNKVNDEVEQLSALEYNPNQADVLVPVSTTTQDTTPATDLTDLATPAG